MKIAIFSAKDYDKNFLKEANQRYRYKFTYFETKLTKETVALAKNFEIVSGFVTDSFDSEVLSALAGNGTRFITLRSAGYNNVDLIAAKKLQLPVARVPAYSPYAVAEFATGLILALNRKIPRAYIHMHEQNFSLSGQLGFDLNGKTVGIIGTGKIGSIFAKIMHGFGCTLLGTDPIQNITCLQYGLKYVELDELYQLSDIISLHCPLNTQTQHFINSAALNKMKNGVMLINTGRGALIDTKAIISALKTKKIGYLGLDVYEEEDALFFENRSSEIIQDDLFIRLESFPNVIITGHQAFFTKEAMTNIAKITLDNINAFERGVLPDTVIN